MDIRWHLRMAAAQREVWTGAYLRRLLAEPAGLEMSAASVSALFTKQPAQLKLQTLPALCTALGCSSNDLLEVDTTPVEAKASPAKATIAPSKAPPGAFDAAGMGIADCARCGGGLGRKAEVLCHRCRAADR